MNENNEMNEKMIEMLTDITKKKINYKDIKNLEFRYFKWKKEFTNNLIEFIAQCTSLQLFSFKKDYYSKKSLFNENLDMLDIQLLFSTLQSKMHLVKLSFASLRMNDKIQYVKVIKL